MSFRSRSATGQPICTWAWRGSRAWMRRSWRRCMRRRWAERSLWLPGATWCMRRAGPGSDRHIQVSVTALTLGRPTHSRAHGYRPGAPICACAPRFSGRTKPLPLVWWMWSLTMRPCWRGRAGRRAAGRRADPCLRRDPQTVPQIAHAAVRGTAGRRGAGSVEDRRHCGRARGRRLFCAEAQGGIHRQIDVTGRDAREGFDPCGCMPK